MSKTEKYNKLADKIYALITKEDPSWGDTLASLELVRLWVLTDFMDIHSENNSKTKPDVFEVK